MNEQTDSNQTKFQAVKAARKVYEAARSAEASAWAEFRADNTSEADVIAAVGVARKAKRAWIKAKRAARDELETVAKLTAHLAWLHAKAIKSIEGQNNTGRSIAQLKTERHVIAKIMRWIVLPESRNPEQTLAGAQTEWRA